MSYYVFRRACWHENGVPQTTANKRRVFGGLALEEARQLCQEKKQP